MSKLENNSIPVSIADSIIDDLPKELFIDPSKKFCYASIVDDYIIRKLYDKLNEGLKDIIVDETERKHHILENMIYGISLSNARTRLVKARSIIKNIYTKNILEDDTSDMPKFDFIIQNPPYNKSLHLDFFNKGLDLLSDTGKMVIIEPSTFYINIRKNGKAKKYDEIKERIKGHVYKVTIENYNKEFGTTNTTPFSITYIDNSKIYKNIEYINCGYKQYVNSLYDCNNIGSYKLIWSILDKLSCDKIKNHKTNEQSNNKNIYYCQLTDYVWGQCGLYIQRPSFCNSDSSYFKHKLGSFFQSFVAPSMHITRNELTNIIPCKAARGGSSKGKVKLTNIPATCLYGTKNEIKNYKYFISNNSLPIFINMIMSIDMANNSLDYIPWLVDKQYTDEEIYEMFGFTNEEIKLIEITIKKYERYSPWFKRYMCGPSSVSDEEVQKFISELENA